MIDGHDLKEVKRRSLVNQMSMVLQEPYLFSGTVKENIRYSHEDVDDEAIYAAARAVGADEFISALEQGYDTVLAERGVNLSADGPGRKAAHGSTRTMTTGASSPTRAPAAAKAAGRSHRRQR